MFQILACNQAMNTLIGAVEFVLNLIRWAIPVVLIILGSIDMFKAMASNDDKKAGEAKSRFIKRLIYAVVAFLIPFIISLAFSLVGQIVHNGRGDINSDIDDVNKQDGNFFECWYNNGNSNNQTATNTDNDDDNVEKCNCHLCMGDNCYDDHISVDDCREDNGTCF